MPEHQQKNIQQLSIGSSKNQQYQHNFIVINIRESNNASNLQRYQKSHVFIIHPWFFLYGYLFKPIFSTNKSYDCIIWIIPARNWILTKPSTTNHWEVLWINRTRITLDQTEKNRDNFLKKVFLNNIQMETVITTEQNSQFKEITRIIRNNKNKKTVSSGTFHIWDSHSCKNNSFSRTQLSVTEKLLRCSS